MLRPGRSARDDSSGVHGDDHAHFDGDAGGFAAFAKMKIAFLLAFLATTVAAAPCDVRAYGAVPDGVTLNTDAINRALGDPTCTEGVIFPAAPEAYLAGSLQLRSDLRFIVAPGATLQGAANDVNAYGPVQPNPWERYQDFGHSHWRNGLIWGESLTNITFMGGGVIDGGGISHLDPPPGGGDKVIALRSCTYVTITNLTFVRTGHFVLLATDVEYLTLTRLTLRPTRDGLDLVGTRHVFAQHLDMVRSEAQCVVKCVEAIKSHPNTRGVGLGPIKTWIARC